MAILKDFKEVRFLTSLSKLFHKLVGLWQFYKSLSKTSPFYACNEHEY